MGDICGLAGGWRFDGAGYGHNLKEPCGPADFSMIIVCCQEQHSPRKEPGLGSVPADGVQGSNRGAQGGAMEKQQALDALRRCWSPNESDLETASQILQAQFMKCASVRQFGEPLMKRSDIAHLLGKRPPPGLREATAANSTTASAARKGPTNMEVGELYDNVL